MPSQAHYRKAGWTTVTADTSSSRGILDCGIARVTIGDDIVIVHENESMYVPIGSRQRLDPGKIELELIGVQTGSYLGEDDIVRIEDDYHRS